MPTGFSDTIALSGLAYPSAVAFAPDGKIFVAERTGVIMVFDSLSDRSPTQFADLSNEVYNQYDRGMLGLAVDPHWPTRPYVYALYTYDGDPGGPYPKWGKPPEQWDDCPDPPGANTLGCVVSSRLSRLTASGDTMKSEKVLVSGWCQQFSSHSVGTLKFGSDGSLYATGGEGASYLYADYGQTRNPCGDPPAPAGTSLTPPTAEGGSLRSQSPRRAANEPVALNGTLIRVNPDTGDGVSGNPMFSSADINRRRIVAFGFRNPFRFNLRPGTNEIWIGDVGAGTWEEINRVPNVDPTSAYNFGWPCYEGAPVMPSFQNLNLSLCKSLYQAGPSAVTAPYYAYQHGASVVAGDGCADSNGSSISGLAFYSGTTYPNAYRNALFFEDYSRNCIWYLPKQANGLPDAAHPHLFALNAANPVDLESGPGGDLFYVDILGGTIHRIVANDHNSSPVAVATATPSSGPAPLAVKFSAAQSSDPNGDPLTYSWDLNGDSIYGDATTVTASSTYSHRGVVTVGLRVTDPHGATGSTTVTVSVGSPPAPYITAPTSATKWKVGDKISFSGGATDAVDGHVAAANLNWTLLLHHCPNGAGCHIHPSGMWSGVASGSFSAPDHEYPSYLELVLTATDSAGLSATTSINLMPATVTVKLVSKPAGLALGLSDQSGASPLTVTTLARSNLALDAPSPQALNGVSYTFASWSDGGAAAHNITTPSTGTRTYTATFSRSLSDGPNDSFSGSSLSAAWKPSSTGSSVGVANSELEITHPAGAWTDGSVETVSPYDQTGKAVQLQLRQSANNGAGGAQFGETSITIEADTTHLARFFVAGGAITARVNSGSGETNLTPSWPKYDSTTMQWLRFRESAGTLYWEYAAGAVSPGKWTVLASIADPFTLTAVRFKIDAGANTSTATTAKIDNISTAPSQQTTAAHAGRVQVSSSFTVN